MPAALDAVIARGTAKFPKERYPSSGEFARAARAAIGGVGAAGAAGVVTAAGSAGQFERTETDRTQLDMPAPAVAPGALSPPAPGAPSPPAPGALSPPAPGAPAASSRSGRGPWGGGRTPLYAAAVIAVIVAGVIVAVIVSGSGGHGAPSPSSPPTTVASTTSTAPLTTISTSSATTTSTTVDQAAVYHAQVARIIPRMHAVFRRFPRGSDFGKAVFFSRTSLTVAAGLRGIADNLDALSPPSSLLVDHEALVTHLREMEQAFRSLAADSDNRDFSGAQRDLDRTRAALTKINVSVRRVLRQR